TRGVTFEERLAGHSARARGELPADADPAGGGRGDPAQGPAYLSARRGNGGGVRGMRERARRGDWRGAAAYGRGGSVTLISRGRADSDHAAEDPAGEQREPPQQLDDSQDQRDPAPRVQA